ncbi:hypothetical protein [Streptomyces erythrochromogenes]|uniref:hypothetical protein n=1 Tax=Streptomyces erythrochromogenes TaxID=285574 RepID=UPI00367F5EC8
MAFPQTPIDLRAEMQIGGVWTDITADLYRRAPLSIERGRPDEASSVDPSKATFQLNNRANKYSPRNPRSVNYERIGRNTPVRFSLPAAESYLMLPGGSANIASTPDHSSLDITGDIDVRAELSMDWHSGIGQILMGKWSAVDGNRSWLWRVFEGWAYFVWSPTGLSSGALTAAVRIPDLPRRAALRMTLDVNNGAGGRTASLYTADTLAGPWTLAGTATDTGTTSIFSGSASLEIPMTQYTTTITRYPFVGRFHRAEVRSGIAGSVVASPDVRALAAGTTAWSDSAGRPWTLSGTAEIVDREYRLHAEVSSWPSRWDVSGNDVYVPVEAAGIMRRLGQGSKPLASTLRRRVPTVGLPVAYWPMEEGRDATQAYSPTDGVAPLATIGFQYASDDGLAGSSPLPKVTAAASMRGTVPAHTATGVWMVACMYHSPAEPATETVLLEWTTTGTAQRIVLTAETGNIKVTGYTSTGSTVFAIVVGPTEFHGQWNRLNISAVESGGNVTYDIAWGVVNGDAYGTNTTVAATAGTVTGITTVFGPLAADLAIGHLGVFASTISEDVYRFGDTGWNSERADVRFDRLGIEEGVPTSIADSIGSAEQMGPQRPNSLLTLLRECADADGGIMYEERDRLALRLRPRQSYYNQPVALTLDYTAEGEVAPPLEPVDDDQHVRNDVTRSRVNGSSARAVDETSSMGTAPPPAGVGVYEDSQSLNLYQDSQVEPIAHWQLHLGTWDEARYPTVHIDLAAAPHLVDAVLALDIGDRIQIINPPTWLPPGPIDLIVEGYTEVIGHPNDWNILLNCSPAGPWVVAVADDTTLGRADTSGSVLGAAATDSATTLVVHSEQTAVAWSRPRWSQDPARYPADLQLGGEVVTASAVAELAADTFGRTVAAGGWGTASDGLHTYTLTGGTSSERSVGSGRGVVTVTSSQTNLRAQTLAETCEDCDIRVQVAVSATATGGSLAPCVLMRWASVSVNYRARVEFTTGGTISLSASVGSTIIGSNAATGLSYTPGATFEVRVRLIEHRILMRIWPTGTTEPILWHLDRTAVTGTITSGAIGLGTAGLTGNSNASVEYRFDDFLVESPQRVTVTRAVNAVTKAHAAGTRVRLAQPARAAL